LTYFFSFPEKFGTERQIVVFGIVVVFLFSKIYGHHC